MNRRSDDERLVIAIRLLAQQVEAVMDAIEADTGPDSFDRSALDEMRSQLDHVWLRHKRNRPEVETA
jgi:hypothetical protein